MLSIVAGLEAPTSGSVLYRDQQVRGPRTDMGYLTQQDTLMPWRNIVHNVEMPLEIRGASAAERRRRAEELIQLVGLKGVDHHYPRELSGGMLRRASLARMLTADSETLLMDEPFGALDAQLRLELQNELLSLWSGSNKTVLFVTHDIEEAIVLGDRAIVLGVPGHIVADVPITRGLAKADAFIHGNTAEVETLMASYLTGLAPAVTKAALAAFMPALPQTPAVSQQGYDVAVQFHEQAGLIKTAPTYDQLVDSAFITKSLS